MTWDQWISWLLKNQRERIVDPAELARWIRRQEEEQVRAQVKQQDKKAAPAAHTLPFNR